MAYEEVAGSRRSTPDSHSVQYHFDSFNDIENLLQKGKRAPWIDDPASIETWTVSPFNKNDNGGTVTIEAKKNSDVANFDYQLPDPEDNTSCSCSDSNIRCRKEWWGVRRATLDDIENYEIKNIHEAIAKIGDLVYANAISDTENKTGAPDHSESPFLNKIGSKDVHPSIDWIDKSMPTKNVQITFYSEKKIRNFYHLSGVMDEKVWPRFVREFLWNITGDYSKKWRYVCGSVNSQRLNGKNYSHVTRNFEYLLHGYWDPAKNGGLCTQWES